MPMTPMQREAFESLLPVTYGRDKEALAKYGAPLGGTTKTKTVLNGDYPTEWEEFIGQDAAVHQLKIAISSAKKRGTRLDHTLLASGAHGIGKTTLAQIAACQMGTEFKSVSGPITIDDGRRVIGKMHDGDVLFWDEFHLAVSGNKARADWLLPFLTDSVLLTPTGSVKMPHITVMAATTDVGKLPQTIISRFMLRPRLDMYTNAEARLICEKLAGRMNAHVAPGDYAGICRAANNNPRDMRMVLSSLRDQQVATGTYDVRLAYAWAGLTEDGLTREAMEMMQVLYGCASRTMSIEGIQATLSEPGPLRHHEQLLLQRGYVVVTPRGRMLTEEGAFRVEMP